MRATFNNSLLCNTYLYSPYNTVLEYIYDFKAHFSHVQAHEASLNPSHHPLLLFSSISLWVIIPFSINIFSA